MRLPRLAVLALLACAGAAPAFPSPGADSRRFLYVDSRAGDREKVIRLTSAPGRSSVSAPPLARGGDVEIHLPHPLRQATLGGRPATAAYDAPTRRLRVPFPAGQELRLVVEY